MQPGEAKSNVSFCGHAGLKRLEGYEGAHVRAERNTSCYSCEEGSCRIGTNGKHRGDAGADGKNRSWKDGAAKDVAAVQRRGRRARRALVHQAENTTGPARPLSLRFHILPEEMVKVDAAKLRLPGASLPPITEQSREGKDRGGGASDPGEGFIPLITIISIKSSFDYFGLGWFSSQTQSF